MSTPQMHMPQRTQTEAEAALLALHKLLHPEAHHEGADRIDWTAETIESADTIICETVEHLGLLPRTTW